MNITVKEAAEVTGWSQAYIRSACRRGIIGDAWSNGNGERMTCVVSPGRLAEFLGKKVEEIEHEVRYLRFKKLGQGVDSSDKP